MRDYFKDRSEDSMFDYTFTEQTKNSSPDGELLFRIVIDCFNDLHTRSLVSASNSEDNIRELKMLNELLALLYGNIYDFFMPITIKNTTEIVLSNPDVRDFVFNLTDTVLVTSEINYIDLKEIISKVVGVLCNIKGWTGKKSLLPEGIQSELSINMEYITELLYDNLWLFVLYVLKMQIGKTELSKTIYTV